MSLQAQSVSVRFGGNGANNVLNDVTCQAAPRSVTALIGPNGSGKSTLLRCLAGALRPRAGNVLLDGEPILRLRAARRAARLAYVPQNNPVGFDFTVRELVRLGVSANPTVLPAKSTEERVARALDVLDLAPLAERSLLALSGGEQQRAAIARALAQDTPYLLLDEPTAHLDLRYQSALLDLMRRFARERGRAVLVVLHDLNHAAACADRLVLLDAGRVAAEGAPADVLTSDLLGHVYQTPVSVRPDSVTGRLLVSADLPGPVSPRPQI